MRRILLSHGGGGEDTWRLIRELFLKHLYNEHLIKLEDATVLEVSSKIAFTTDSFTVNPIFFRGGNIGKLAVAGTVNDLSVMGAKPLYMSVGFIIEEGFPYEDLESIVISMKEEAQKSGVLVVAGDTKVVPKGTADGLFINTSGIGKVVCEGLSCSNIKVGDAVIVSGGIGEHGACILAQREGIQMDVELESDCRSLWSLIEKIITSGAQIHAMRDPTRGGLSAVLYEWASNSNISFLIDEESIPVKEPVLGLCELLGLEPYHLACEGRVVVALPERHAQKVLSIMRSHPDGEGAQIIGRAVPAEGSPKVILRTSYGTHRVLDPPAGELLPRIC
ncbi:hydrogenase expression/formation protein HypE [Hydrogenobacter thermophilus TK-6]|uniref:Hydrogenase expression/formation protein n=2 Tax=Hydrogenobacter thermophilus TaxID=940 RepID=D3DI12_HYDTT|nr:hydrogenase expression/formation protein HypE [Hydrogenobacter thermophilus]ADO45397.1 hydrogenase expression/formation protein HypE [Hydrogenobacter thermophilus TK-6]BAF73682.1 hydrogenase expression/formation protein [Hydrogenobacter thermophilus TK-6]BAI69464.1 hydrogenase expression/formation protein [Hydrogenobacter thermophilus TK-6]